MPASPLEVLNEFLTDAWDQGKLPELAERLVADDAEYISLNFEDPDLKRIMPWAGTNRGRGAFVTNFRNVTTRWTFVAFETHETLEDDDKVAIFGSFSLRSVKLNQVVTSLVGVFAKVSDGKITQFRYLEDTFATARSFRSGGTWTIQADPSGPTIEV